MKIGPCQANAECWILVLWGEVKLPELYCRWVAIFQESNNLFGRHIRCKYATSKRQCNNPTVFQKVWISLNLPIMIHIGRRHMIEYWNITYICTIAQILIHTHPFPRVTKVEDENRTKWNVHDHVNNVRWGLHSWKVNILDSNWLPCNW